MQFKTVYRIEKCPARNNSFLNDIKKGKKGKKKRNNENFIPQHQMCGYEAEPVNKKNKSRSLDSFKSPKRSTSESHVVSESLPLAQTSLPQDYFSRDMQIPPFNLIWGWKSKQSLNTWI